MSEDNETQNRPEAAIEAFQDADPREVNRSARSGRFVSDEDAAANPDTTVTETMTASADETALPHNVEAMRRFYLWRETDITEVTVPAGGEARSVAVGVVFADGRVALWWAPPENSRPPEGSIAVWTDITHLQATHLHTRSQTRLVWVD